MDSMVNGHLLIVNTHLLKARYVLPMAKSAGKKRGPKKGTTKPFRRPLDDEFPDRLLAAMRRRGFIRSLDGSTMNAALAREVRCERATIGQYLNKERPKRSIDALLLLQLCDELWVTPYWLARNQGSIDDVEKNRIPMQDLRFKTRGKVGKGGTDEADGERTRGA